MSSWEEFFNNFSYKPNWTFSLWKEDYYVDDKVFKSFVFLKIEMKVPDARQEGSERIVGNNITLEPWMGEEFAKNLIRDCIRRMEEHEINEWFRYKGELVFDPHKDEEKV